jgi:putative addiction module component (TIGR02574 family)
MASRERDIESRALSLPSKHRARLAARLIDSLDGGVDEGSDAVWEAEGERRLDEIKAGRVRGIPAGDVFKRARSRLR